MVLEGFFPLVAADARPHAPRRAGLTAIGLPYPSDAAITRCASGGTSESAVVNT